METEEAEYYQEKQEWNTGDWVNHPTLVELHSRGKLQSTHLNTGTQKQVWGYSDFLPSLIYKQCSYLDWGEHK